MDFFALLVTAVGLSMDAFSVALCKGLSLKEVRAKEGVITGLYFGGFQAFMPIIGYFLGSAFYSKIQAWDHWIAFGLLAFLGVNMIVESFKEEDQVTADFTPKEMIPLAVATSIDALIVGVTFAILKVNIYVSALFIGVCTFVLSFIGVCLGFKFGQKFERGAQILGGVLLILIGAKVLIDHLGLLA